jgi:ring-1,2-phenylacetyl-CoA epoxidase subunit PaaD
MCNAQRLNVIVILNNFTVPICLRLWLRRASSARAGRNLDTVESDVRSALLSRGVREVTITTVFAPAWTTDWIGAEAREKLRAYGIAPPGKAEPQGLVTLTRGRAKAVCPFCGSADTRLQSEFGSTACKAIHVCNSCRQPFDEFKAF